MLEAGATGVTIEAPLEPNVNHQSTAFGGSVAALALLAGWTLIHLRLRSEGLATRTVIQSSTVRFDAPVLGTFKAVCGPVADDAWERFTRAVRRRGKGRLHVVVNVEADGRVVASFQGAYVAVAKRWGDGDD